MRAAIKSRAVCVAAMTLVIVLATSVPATAQQDTSEPTRVRISEAVLKAFLLHKVLPEYPEDALKRGIEGTVTTDVFIDSEGNVERTANADGNSTLVAAVTDAVKQWKFKPYYLKRKPIPIESQVTLTFELKGGKGTVRY
jgi:TonB family protein